MSESVFVAMWMSSGLVVYGMTTHHFQTAYPVLAEQDYVKDRIFAAVMGILGMFGGPLTIVVLLVLYGLVHKGPIGWRL